MVGRFFFYQALYRTGGDCEGAGWGHGGEWVVVVCFGMLCCGGVNARFSGGVERLGVQVGAGLGVLR